MLRVLRVKNFALMEDLTIDLDKGLTVVTGETGAGKSMIVEAIAALCGERIEDISIRSGKDFAEITGLFELTQNARRLLKESGIEVDDEPRASKEGRGELVIRRRLARGKHQLSYINDQIVSLGLLKELTKEMVDLVGQYENQSLFSPKNQLSLLDRYAGLEDLKDNYHNNFQEYKALQNRLEVLVQTKKERGQRLDFLKYESSEIEKANWQPLEEENLILEKNLLSSSEKRSSLTTETITVLYESDNSIYGKLSKIKKFLDEMAVLDPSLKELAQKTAVVITTIDDSYRQLSTYQQSIEFSQERYDDVLDRLETINRLKKKYGNTIKEVNDYLAKAKKELLLIETNEEEIEKIKAEIGELAKVVTTKAEELSVKRQAAAQNLKKKILAALTRLDMEKAEFDIKFSNKNLGEDGKDEVEFYISTNPGEELKPLRKVASGGEISRITLGLKTILSDADKIPTMIFDEVDTGIGGRVAESIGELLSMVSQRHQILCITHLPQISVFGHNHILVKKESKGKITSTKVVKLDAQMRKLEIARMLGGKEITRKTIEHAEEILQKGQQK